MLAGSYRAVLKRSFKHLLSNWNGICTWSIQWKKIVGKPAVGGNEPYGPHCLVIYISAGPLTSTELRWLTSKGDLPPVFWCDSVQAAPCPHVYQPSSHVLFWLHYAPLELFGPSHASAFTPTSNPLDSAQAVRGSLCVNQVPCRTGRVLPLAFPGRFTVVLAPCFPLPEYIL